MSAAEKAFAQQAEDYPAHAMAWMHHATWKGPVKIPLDHIDPDMKWMDGADPDHVQDFVAKLKAGKKLKPSILVAVPGGEKLHLIDGHHRYLAAAEMGEPLRGLVGTVGQAHGGWETMHDFQQEPGPEKGTKAASDLDIWARANPGLGIRVAADIWNDLAGAR